MKSEPHRIAILEAIKRFCGGDLTQNSLALFETLGYNTVRQAPLDTSSYPVFKETFITDKPFNEERAKTAEWKHVDLLFQLSKEEILQQTSLFDTGRVDQTIIETYLFFTIDLSNDHYSRTELSQITREVNRLFPMPAMILFKHGETLTLSVINRRLHKRDDSKDVLEKVTQIKDISIQAPHRAHIEILFDLSFDELKRRHKVTNFVELHNAWQKTLDTKELNKRFYRELANWYFWAMEHVQFPDDIEKNTDVRNATNLIRLITRVVFIWFIKEKHLVPEQIFERKFINKILKDFLVSEKSHNYYNAILQNLFFGTLNQKIEDRKFANEGDISVNVKEYGVKNLFRYPGMFRVHKDEVLDLFKDIPFLNGGLFDCLDKTEANGKVIYGDGFSRNSNKRATIPDFLFFGDEKDVDLNKVFGTKNRRYTTKGLINLLAGYKFTVTENTPIEEEVALDPELLGKTFENLLASYNPETQTTARKQTGSFYTPREIVNYMVDESLREYLKQAIEDKSDDFEVKIRDLFSYNENKNPFPEPVTRKLIEALNQCKILDPACGSGAFPMGILHKMVHVLQKLDPDNSYWRELQEQKAIAETKEAYKIGDQKERDQRLTEISDVFENNTSDYGRKLYLIENCIYGVDIQPIAVQISKLRFFISLVIDQKPDMHKENYGIRSLPNLETKFVAANTLIGLEVPTTDLFTAHNPVEKLQDELKATRHAYFNARNRDDKLKLQEDDHRICSEIAAMISETLLQNCESDIKRLESQLETNKAELNKLLQKPEDKEIIENTNLLGEVEMTVYKKGEGRINKLKASIRKIEKQIETLKSSYNTDTFQNVANQIASFDPYDQNQFAGWFEPEWMFGEDVKKGFDIVIGNPPYLRIQGVQEATPELVPYAKKNYVSAAKGNWDLYVLFTEAGYKMLEANGILAFIQPHKFFQGDFGVGIRNFISKEKCLYHIVHFGAEQMFESATNYTCLFFLQKQKRQAFSYIKIDQPDVWFQNPQSIPARNLPQPENNQKWSFSSEKNHNVLNKILKQPQTLGDIVRKIFVGLQTSSDKIYVLKTVKWLEKTAILYSFSLKKDVEIEKGLIKPFLMGKDLKRYEKPEPKNVVIFPYVTTTEKASLMTQEYIQTNYPLGWGYLLENRIDLENRENGKMKHENFYAYIYPKNLSEFEAIKIITPEIAIKPQLTLDENGIFYHTTKVYSFIFKKDIKENKLYWLGLLNSKLLWFFLNSTGYVLRGGYYTFKTEYLKPFPVKRINFNCKWEVMLYEKIIRNVQQILENKQRVIDTTALERCIDEMVFKLYDLTYEEVKLIAPDFWLSEEEYEGVVVE